MTKTILTGQVTVLTMEILNNLDEISRRELRSLFVTVPLMAQCERCIVSESGRS